jgi:type IV pilus assembly protein PilW
MAYTMKQQRGFTLIELMIGVTISLMGLAAVGSMMATFSQKRSGITQTLAAQDNGVMALYRLERDISQAGYGLMGLQNCASIAKSGAALTPFPVVIASGGAGVSDTITVQYGGGGTGSGVPGGALNSITAGTSLYNVASSAGFANGEYVVASTDCVLRQVAATPVVGAGTVAFTPTTLSSVAAAGTLANLGNVFVSRIYQVSGNALTLAELNSSVASATLHDAANNLVDDIVFIKAQYGLASSVSATTVASWAASDTFTVSNANSKQVIAVRIGVVARSAQKESGIDAPPASVTVLPQISDSGTVIGAQETYTIPASDLNFRHRTYSTIIPLRNVIWTR